MNKIIKGKILQLNKICKKYNTQKLYVFGSVLNDNFNDKSDIDFIVSFNHVNLRDYADNFFNLKEELKDLFKREIDLIEEETITNPYFKNEILSNRELIYE